MQIESPRLKPEYSVRNLNAFWSANGWTQWHYKVERFSSADLQPDHFSPDESIKEGDVITAIGRSIDGRADATVYVVATVDRAKGRPDVSRILVRPLLASVSPLRTSTRK